MLRFQILAGVFLGLVATGANAAEFALRDPEAAADGKFMVQGIEVSGEIASGDFEKFSAVLDTVVDGGDGRFGWALALYLNSPGGSYQDGLKIGALVRERGIGTVIEKGASCYSSCAFIFMHGSQIFEGQPVVERWMNPDSVLGFHAPYLTISKGQVSSELVSVAYQEALKQISQLLKSSHTVLSNDLLQQMLLVPPEQMLLVETYGQSLAWNIGLGPEGQGDITSITRAQMVMACQAIQDIEADRVPGLTLREAEEREDAVESFKVGADVFYRVDLTIVADWTTICVFSVEKNRNDTLTVWRHAAAFAEGSAPPKMQLLDWRYFLEPGTKF